LENNIANQTVGKKAAIAFSRDVVGGVLGRTLIKRVPLDGRHVSAAVGFCFV
jgi:hypothetical protein